LEHDVEQVRLRAPDGYELGATFYRASAAGEVRRAAVLHCGAGVQAALYTRFASFLAAAGIPVLTYDYRGIGRSRPERLRGFAGTLEDCAEFDCTAAIGWLRERFPRAELIGIAHSIGALLLGGARNAAEQDRIVMIGAHTGYYRDYRWPYRLPMTALWHVLMPSVTWLLGYFPARMLRLGDDIPFRVAMAWAARWSGDLRSSGGGMPAERRRQLLERCAALQRPVLVVGIADDAFSTPEGAERLLSYYPRIAPRRYLEFTPADAGTRRIGHFGFFRRANGAALWPRLLAMLNRGV
jgi:predicted alpha/beta hydrolase